MMAAQRDLELINGYCSGSLTQAEFLELQHRLRQSSQSRRLLVEYRSIEAALSGALPADKIQPAARGGVIRRWRNEIIAIAAAIMLLVSGVVYLWSRGPMIAQSGDAPHVAVVAQAVGAYDGEDVAIRSGQHVMAGGLSLDRGLIQLDFLSGATVVVEGPAKIEAIDEMRMVLLRGVVTAKIPESAIGFIVDTELTRVVDLGTAFGVSVGDDLTTHVSVFEGTVSVNRNGSASSDPTLVHEGQSVRASTQSSAIDSMDYDVTPFENAWQVNSGVLQSTGSIRFVSPGPDVHPGNYKDNEHIVVFPERTCFLSEEIRVDMVDPGQYARTDYDEKAMLPAGKRLKSYLLQMNAFPEGEDPFRRRSARGQITFAKPIVGVITMTALLQESESIFGDPDLDYPTAREVEPRPEGDDRIGFDKLILAADQRTLLVELQENPGHIDQIRVLVEADETTPQPRTISEL